MPKYIIERDVPGVGSLSLREQKAGALKSLRAVKELGIQWQQSYICGNKTFCVYIADNKDIVRKHAERSGFPATKITEVKTMHDPTTAEMPINESTPDPPID
ncbi:hypothetical protein CRI94_02315 [Longibacter salinarum]|uniref:DUF4242 domain-containing protein n=1 Tax=Longibacter salinarum TaxID=1850348 RepID=A0A2A8D2P2_9BACT|nr:DUF4242 domain-containing protein [Longibacter salinarum]PEN15141.1 hypothetical protein CRI94_02315 [Longibacter salinarum]